LEAKTNSVKILIQSIKDQGTHWVEIVKNCHFLGQQEKMNFFFKIQLYKICTQPICKCVENILETLTTQFKRLQHLKLGEKSFFNLA